MLYPTTALARFGSAIHRCPSCARPEADRRTRIRGQF